MGGRKLVRVGGLNTFSAPNKLVGTVRVVGAVKAVGARGSGRGGRRQAGGGGVGGGGW